MTDKALKNAERKRDSLAAEINSLAQRMEELKRDLAKIDAWIAQWHELSGTLATSEAADSISMSSSVSGSSGESKKRRATGNPSKEDVAAKVKELILERGAPIARNDLFDALESRGIIIRGADPKMVLSTMLWRTEDIIRLAGYGYWPKDRPFEPAGYSPDKAFEDTMSEENKNALEEIW